jgi:oxygen-independent coproporphyrinogen-3 oxidase
VTAPSAKTIRILPGAGPATPGLTSLPPLALYIHVPWCVRKCPYCDFNSHARPDDPGDAAGAGLPEREYEASLMADLEEALPRIWGRRVETVFFGGGTPSLLSAGSVDRILAGVRARVPVSPDAEVTLEANPGTVEAARFAGFRAAGINRLSIGVQSFDDRQLVSLGRIHDGLAARRAIDLALEAVGNVNIDLMYALPGQTVEQARADLAIAIASGVPHLSAYHLTLEPNTFFASHPPANLPDDDLAADIQDAVDETLVAAGFDHYETSAHARPGHACRHNLNYWRFGDYLGIGPGAHSKLSFPDRIVREARVRLPRDWMRRALDADAVQSSQVVGGDELPFEFMMNALRLSEGVERSLFGERTGLPITAMRAALGQACERGLLEDDPFRFRATALGRRFLNDLLSLFLSPPGTARDA